MLQRTTLKAFFLLSISSLVCLGFADGHLAALSPAEASALGTCEDLISDFSFEETTLDQAGIVAAEGQDPAYCLVTGHMYPRTSEVDGKDYAIRFEMRLPSDWNGRFLYQGNGGTDGNVAAAIGRIGAPPVTALQHGFAIISSDAGHPTRSSDFGLDPQARLDYGYQAVAKLTPMAKALIESAYGKGPDRSYIGGSSNGGRHALVAASRYADDYDGILAIAPGFNLPRAAVAQLWGAQQWAPLATELSVPGDPDTGLATALTNSEREVIANAILAQCDALDGLTDGMVQDIYSCQAVFDVMRDVPECSAERDGSCVSSEQLEVIADVFDGAETSDGESFYSSWVYDAGIKQQGWADWKFKFSVNNQRDAVAYGYIFGTPPNPPGEDTLAYALALDIDEAVDSIFASDDTYTESSMSFMTPPDPTNLDNLRDRGGKVLVVHGASDAIFSMQDTVDWYNALDAAYDDEAEEFARLFLVPGMGHSRGGPATDQYDALMALVEWVEQGEAPERITANVQANNAEAENWSSNRSRPLCMYPQVAMYTEGDPEDADSFVCTDAAFSKHANLAYGSAIPGNLLDLYLPHHVSENALPLLIWHSGSAWFSPAAKDSASAIDIAKEFTARGFAVATISIRSSFDARFPAQGHDVRAAIRYLRKHAAAYGIHPYQFAFMGNSSGGWATAFAATTSDTLELPGEEAVNGVSSAVQVAVPFFPPTDFLSMDSFGAENDLPMGFAYPHDAPTSPEGLLIQCPGEPAPALPPTPEANPELLSIQECPEETEAADPSSYIDGVEIPLWVLHGGADPLLPFNQSQLVYESTKAEGNEARYTFVPAAEHDVGTIIDAEEATTWITRGAEENISEGRGPSWDDIEAFIRAGLDAWQ